MLLTAMMVIASHVWDARIEPLVDAVAQVESRGNARAVGDQGKAIGVLQIHEITVRDANRIMRVNRDKSRPQFNLEDRWDPEKSREIFTIIAMHYSLNESDEVIARRWNGGPGGDRRRSTMGYWNKVKKELK
jgi:soluble lytic murein transglycosylase-like protein